MQTRFSGGTTTRGLQVEKMKGVSVNTNLISYSIDKTGIEMPTSSLFRENYTGKTAFSYPSFLMNSA